MKRFIHGFLALLLLTAPGSAQLATPAVGTWAQLPNTVLYPVIPSQAKSEGAPGGTPEFWSPHSLFDDSGADVGQLPGSSTWGFLIWWGRPCGHPG